jgi:hypothetical protein
MHIGNPESLSDAEWAKRIRELEWVRQEEKRSAKD